MSPIDTSPVDPQAARVPASSATVARADDRRSRRRGERVPDDGTTREIGGPAGPEPTRYGDWERNGRCCDF